MDAYATHLPVLVRLLSLDPGPALELGAGMYSTPVLHAFSHNRKVMTAESDSAWLSQFMNMASPNHTLSFVAPDRWADFQAIDFPSWGLVLVDHAPGERRKVDIERLSKTNARFVVVHDSQEPGYNYTASFGLFRFKRSYGRYSTETMVLSNVAEIPILT